MFWSKFAYFTENNNVEEGYLQQAMNLAGRAKLPRNPSDVQKAINVLRAARIHKMADALEHRRAAEPMAERDEDA